MNMIDSKTSQQQQTGNTERLNMKQIYVVLNQKEVSSDWHIFSNSLMSAYTNRSDAIEDAQSTDLHFETVDAYTSQGRFYFDSELTKEIPVVFN